MSNGGAGNAGGTANVGGTTTATMGGSGDGGGTNPVCQMASYKFEPKIPTVFMLVDQSGSMWGCRASNGTKDPTGRECANKADTSWYPLRDGVLKVVEELEKDVRFGFSAFTGETADAQCPVMQPVAPDFNNYMAIAANYNGLKAPAKGETPTTKALAQVGALLEADKSPGDKFILFVTDGQPDYCDDSNNLCPPDSVVGALQTLAAKNIKTLVFGISSPLTTISDSVLLAFANAGAGQPVVTPGTTRATDFYDQCNGIAGWRADFMATAKPAERGQTIGTYSEMNGTAKVYKPDTTNQAALVTELKAAISSAKSCSFDLSNVNGQSIKVDLNQLDAASIAIQGKKIALDEANGWSMASATELVLKGTACETWRSPDNNDIDFNFPCKAIIFE
ncbi:MAG TPA: vWA domain-containing protein [Polyangiaceae bacterium]|nr:vWA domain-containing protein [Polyangiaceae bacterium]